MNKDFIYQISTSIIQSGILTPTELDSDHVEDCRKLIELYNLDTNNPEIKTIIKKILTDMNLNPTDTDIIEVMAQIKKLYIDDYM